MRLAGFCHVSCGAVARQVVSAQGSPYLSCLQRQLGDRRRRKGAHERLRAVVHRVVARAVSGRGVVVEGLRLDELEQFREALKGELVALVKLRCGHGEMVSRLARRGSRAGDRGLGLEDMDDAARVQAYCQREAAELEALKAYKVVEVDAEAHGTAELVEEVLQQLEALRPVAHVVAVGPKVDWEGAVSLEAADLDRDFHPDGKPKRSVWASIRSQEVESTTVWWLFGLEYAIREGPQGDVAAATPSLDLSVGVLALSFQDGGVLRGAPVGVFLELKRRLKQWFQAMEVHGTPTKPPLNSSHRL